MWAGVRAWDGGAVTSVHHKETSLLSHSTFRRCRTILAGGIATVLAALAITAPAGASVPDSPESWGADQVGLNFTQPAAQDISFHFTRPGG
jgi:hypothetical protein